MSRQKSRPNAPSKEAIAEHWNGPIACWVCGTTRGLERAHIVPHSLEGPNHPDNFALLCSEHHLAAPDVGDREVFLAWVEKASAEYVTTIWSCLGDLSGIETAPTDLNAVVELAIARLGGVALHGGRFSQATREAIATEVGAVLRGEP